MLHCFDKYSGNSFEIPSSTHKIYIGFRVHTRCDVHAPRKDYSEQVWSSRQDSVKNLTSD